MTDYARQRLDAGRPPPNSRRQAELSYTEHRRVLFRALSGLARTGYPAPPGEGMDLIHDFYIDAWPGISARYDASRASFDTYLFACFVRFARPRIARLARLRGSLVGPAELEIAAQDRGATFGEAVDASDVPAVRAALSALPPAGRALLDAYLDDADVSERALAARFGMTRYAVRVTLADMLGLMAVRLGAASGLGEPDRAVALALWADQRSPRQAAALLGTTTDAIQATKIRLFTRLVEATRGSRKMSSTVTTDARSLSAAPSALVAAALAPQATDRDLAAVRTHAAAVCAYLDTVADEAEAEPIAAAEGDRLAAFYGALAGAMTGPDDGFDDPMMAQILEARAGDERQVGHAFEVLRASVPGAWSRFVHLFRDLPEVGAAHLASLRDDPSLDEVGTEARITMERYGVTPVVVAEAARSLSNTAMEFCIQRGIERGGRFQFEARPDQRDGGLPLLERWTAEEELGLDLAVDRATAEALYDWLHGVAGELPLLFDGFETRVTRGGALVLTRTDASEPDLLKRWHARQVAAIAC